MKSLDTIFCLLVFFSILCVVAGCSGSNSEEILIFSDKSKSRLETKIELNESFSGRPWKYSTSSAGIEKTNHMILLRKQKTPLLESHKVYWVISFGYSHSLPHALVVTPGNEGVFFRDVRDVTVFLKDQDYMISSAEQALKTALLAIKLTETYNFYHIDNISQTFKPSLKNSLVNLGREDIATQSEKELIFDMDPDSVLEPKVSWDNEKKIWHVEDIFFWDWISGDVFEFNAKFEGIKINLDRKKIGDAGFALRYVYPNYAEWEWDKLPQLPNNSLTDEPVLVDSDNF